MRVLIADDDRTTLALLRATLARRGLDIVVAGDGAAALTALLADDAPEIAILDWMMPGEDGVEVCRALRAANRPRRPHVILLTARRATADVVEGLAAGADDFMTKPFEPAELLARIDVGGRIVALRDALGQRVAELERALAEVRTLQGMLTICMDCKRIRVDEEAWQRVESYVESRSAAQFTHSLCPSCERKRGR
jgi:DNA-binding response OmpR family regulator